MRAEYEKAKAATATLATNPKDEKANAVYGRFLALHKNDWERALPLLLAGNDEKLKNLAVREAKKPTEAAEQVELGEAWMELAAGQPEPDKSAMAMRGYHWLRLARPQVGGLKKAKLDNLMKAASRQYLIDLNEFDVKAGQWNFGKGVLCGGDDVPIRINEKQSLFGLGMLPPSNGMFSVKYRLAKAAKTFAASVALNDTVSKEAGTAVTFMLFADGKQIWASKPVKHPRQSQPCFVSVSGVEVLELRVNCPGDHFFEHAVWIDPYIGR